MKGRKVFVGLSGGVDSAVTAALLQKEGAQVTGVFIKGWYPPGMPCTWASDRRDAMRVAARLHIPFVTLDASTEYKQGVIDYLLREYKAGRTPNPDVMCNREVKFGAFYDYALAEGADLIATGHYARTQNGSLFRGIDETKDQSYFLWAVPTKALAKTLFPLGEMHKDRVRVLAKEFDLPVAQKADSQGICFLGNISVEDFLREEFGEHMGNAVSPLGETVGTHNGALLHTIGERIALTDAAAGPWYVVGKDLEQNRLIVSKERSHETGSSIALSETNWFEVIDALAIYEAQYRYHGPRIKGSLSVDGTYFTPLTNALTEPVAKGQSLVLYQSDQCSGGGIIG